MEHKGGMGEEDEPMIVHRTLLLFRYRKDLGMVGMVANSVRRRANDVAADTRMVVNARSNPSTNTRMTAAEEPAPAVTEGGDDSGARTADAEASC